MGKAQDTHRTERQQPDAVVAAAMRELELEISEVQCAAAIADYLVTQENFRTDNVVRYTPGFHELITFATMDVVKTGGADA